MVSDPVPKNADSPIKNLALYRELCRERDPISYDPNIWWHYPQGGKNDGI